MSINDCHLDSPALWSRGGYRDAPNFIPGEHVVLVSKQENAALTGRYDQWELRDTLLALTPGPSALYLLLFRVPLSEPTVAQQCLKTGTGGLWIDGCRVGNQIRQATAGVRTKDANGGWGVGRGASGYVKGTGATFTTQGRWPSNLLLIHHPSCANQANENQCHPSCPVVILDDHSGIRPSAGLDSPSNARPVSMYRTGNRKIPGLPQGPLYDDTGGASRFYPQFKNFPECLDWVTRLIQSPA